LYYFTAIFDDDDLDAARGPMGWNECNPATDALV
jgi:hypothetical protein